MTNVTRLIGMQHAGLPHDWVPVTPSDSEPLDKMGFAIRVETAGNVRCKTLGSKTVNRDYYIQIGEILPVAVLHILSTGTTASGIFVADAD